MTALYRTAEARRHGTPMPFLEYSPICDECNRARSNGNHRACSKKRQAVSSGETSMTETEKMIRSIEALLDLDARGALVPHGVGGLARWLLSQCAELLAKPAEQPQGEPVAWEVYWADNGEYYFTSRKRERAAKLIADPDFKIVPLYAERADPGEVERLRHQDAQMRAASSSLRIQLERAKSQLAERDALLREWLKVPLEVSSPEINDLRRKSDYLTASADPEARS